MGLLLYAWYVTVVQAFLACMLAGRSAEAKSLKSLQQSISTLLLEHERS